MNPMNPISSLEGVLRYIIEYKTINDEKRKYCLLEILNTEQSIKEIRKALDSEQTCVALHDFYGHEDEADLLLNACEANSNMKIGPFKVSGSRGKTAGDWCRELIVSWDYSSECAIWLGRRYA